jgi:hypothetical protein
VWRHHLEQPQLRSLRQRLRPRRGLREQRLLDNVRIRSEALRIGVLQYQHRPGQLRRLREGLYDRRGVHQRELYFELSRRSHALRVGLHERDERQRQLRGMRACLYGERAVLLGCVRVPEWSGALRRRRRSELHRYPERRRELRRVRQGLRWRVLAGHVRNQLLHGRDSLRVCLHEHPDRLLQLRHLRQGVHGR